MNIMQLLHRLILINKVAVSNLRGNYEKAEKQIEVGDDLRLNLLVLG